MGVVLRTPRALAEAGLIAPTEVADLEPVARLYAVAVTPEMVSAMRPGEPDDPIARQFVPALEERVRAEDELDDPTADAAHSPVRGLVHRYPDRVLLTPTLACAVYCRFCFRREAVGPGSEGLSAAELEAAFAYIEARPEIFEVILTGGDPMVLSPRRLGAVLQRLEAAPHVKVVRIHTRAPVVDPERISAEMLQVLRGRRFALYVALHVNSARELTPRALGAVAALRGAGVALLSQSVLLKGVNDRPAALEDLMRALVAAGVKPYYLHHLDPAPGTARFRVPLEEARALVWGLRGRVSGLCQPTFVRERPGGAGKVPVPLHPPEAPSASEPPWE